MANLRVDNKMVVRLQFSHVFTNFDSDHNWWISKLGAAGTILHKSPKTIEGEHYGYVVGIWEEQRPKK